MKQYKIVVEKHSDGYVAYPLGIKGVVVGQGDTYEEALSDVKSAIRFHIGNRSWGLLISQLFFHRRNTAVVLEHQLCCEMI